MLPRLFLCALVCIPLTNQAHAQFKVAATPTIPCDIDAFAANIKNAIHGKVRGYSVAIFKKGKLAKRFAGGVARSGANSPARSMSIHDRIELGSISKTLHSIVLLRWLEKKGISVNSSIAPYLPKSWPKSQRIRQGKVTFAMLLSHTSGLPAFNRFDESSYKPGTINDHVKRAIRVRFRAKNQYNNTNYELVRVMLPYIINKAKATSLEGDVKKHELYLAAMLTAHTQAYVFKPANIVKGPALYDATPSSKAIRYYDFSRPSSAGVKANDRRLHPGRGGWKMTATQIAAIISAWNANRHMSVTMTNTMKSRNLGCFRSNGEFGTYYSHRGKSHAGSKSARTVYMVFPNNVVAVLLVNSTNNNLKDDDVSGPVRKAYENACKHPDLQVSGFSRLALPKYQDGKWLVPVRMTIRNRGKATAKGKFVLAVRRGQKWLYVKLTDSLGPGKSRTIDGIVKIKDTGKLLQGRTVLLRAVVDAPVAAADTSMPKWGRVKELNESNNSLKTLSVKLGKAKRIAVKTAPKRVNPRPIRRFGVRSRPR